MPSLTLIHSTTRETRLVPVQSFYPPAYLVLKWGDLSGLFVADLRKGGVIKGITHWRILDLDEALRIYRDLAAQQRNTDRPIRPNDLAALKHWKDKGVL